jgi:tryptophan synthase beta chain
MRALAETTQLPDADGHFGPYGGVFVPETLMPAIQELNEEYERARQDAEFKFELDRLLSSFCGRPTPLYFAERLTKKLRGPRIYLKREDLLHTGAHKINNAMGQILLARRMGKTRVIAERANTESPLRLLRRGLDWSV